MKTAGQRRSELIELVDVAPTVLELCGVQPPPIFQGRSFKPLPACAAAESNPVE